MSSAAWKWLLVMIGALVAGCVSPPEDPKVEGEWGPLAVLVFGGTDMARNEGVIRITDTCVFLNSQGEDILLLWPDVLTTWDAEQRAVVFERIEGLVRDGEPIVTVVDGDPVVLGGGAGPPGSALGEVWIETVDWVAPPRPECVTPSTWGIGDVSHGP